MAIEIIGKLKPKNNGDFSLMDAKDIELSDGSRLEDTIKEIKENNNSSGTSLTQGDNIKIENGAISVITTDDAEENNTKPITSAGVHVIVGNIDSLLQTI